ncbi:type VI secretion system lipoprotein TssJ [Pseudomonas japonica]|uniref:Type VI secretion system protein VasD n=1 Tax=Pseudomonas japonica TaxID=256466 RepID=A0A239CML7_9PSED|nr:type VI secretion system lipoprotein TssJ [Pseudomonas japonica]SNS21179.1 type VI secretion system protein VasD [Pseudomonas japonica]
MKQAIALLLAATTLVGCSSVGNVFKKTGQVLMDPSIQVGSADDQPSQVALSLYASADVNPNPLSHATEEPVDASLASGPGPFTVDLRSASREGLIEHLRSLLDHLESERPNTLGALAVRQRLAIPGLVVDEQAPALTLGKSQPETLFADTATSRGPVPSNWILRQGQARSAAEDEFFTGNPDLGQYGRGPALAQAVEAATTPSRATPIAFRVLQLRDDSLLENANPESLRAVPDKALGSTLLASDDYILVPGQFKFIEFTAVDERARYIAVVADFHDPGAERWHDVFRIEPRGRQYPLMVMLQGSRVAITDESYRPARNSACASPQASTCR